VGLFRKCSFKIILLAYNSYSGGYIMIFTYVLTVHPSCIPLHHSPSSHLLRTMPTGFILLPSYMDTKHIHHIHSHSPFCSARLLSTGTHSQKRPIFPSYPSFFFFYYVYIDVQEGFTLVLQVYIYHALIKLTPSSCYLLILYHHTPPIFNSLLYSALYYIHL
jgi:hypothetical protein